MKFYKVAILLLAIIALSCVTDARRIRRHRRHRGIAENLKDLGFGFISGLSGIDGEGLNKCFPENWTSNAVKKDNGSLPAEISLSDLGCLQYLLGPIKIILDVACIFKDSLLQAFGYVVRRRRFRRRIFLQTKLRNKLGTLWPAWIRSIARGVKSAWNWMTEKYNQLRGWIHDRWGDFKVWAKKKWEAIKDWTKEQWDRLTNFCKEAVEKAKTVYRTVVNYVTTAIVPIVKIIIACGELIYKIVSNIISVVRAIIAIVSGNVVDWAVMIVNLICNYSELWKIVQIGIAIFKNAGQRWYFTGKFIGTLLTAFGNTVSARPKVETATAVKKDKSFLDSVKSIAEWLENAYNVKKAYDSVSGNIDAMRDIHSSGRTGSEDRGDGSVQFLDRHNVDCGVGKGISWFHLMRPSSNLIAYEFECSGNSSVGNTLTEYATPWNDYKPDKGTNYLDRHNVKCPEGEILSRFQIENIDNDRKLRYTYSCSTARLCKCEDSVTPNQTGGDEWQTEYLDRHNVGYKGNKNRVLTRFQLKTHARSSRYEMRTCELC